MLNLLRIEKVAEILDLSRARVYQLAADGDLPSVRIGRSVRVPADGLEQWVRERTSNIPDESQAQDVDE